MSLRSFSSYGSSLSAAVLHTFFSQSRTRNEVFLLGRPRRRVGSPSISVAFRETPSEASLFESEI